MFCIHHVYLPASLKLVYSFHTVVYSSCLINMFQKLISLIILQVSNQGLMKGRGGGAGNVPVIDLGGDFHVVRSPDI